MGLAKKISNCMEKAESKYHEIEEDTRGARRVGTKILDWAIPPPKKKQKSSKFKTVKKGGCTCKCPK